MRVTIDCDKGTLKFKLFKTEPSDDDKPQRRHISRSHQESVEEASGKWKDLHFGPFTIDPEVTWYPAIMIAKDEFEYVYEVTFDE